MWHATQPDHLQSSNDILLCLCERCAAELATQIDPRLEGLTETFAGSILLSANPGLLGLSEDPERSMCPFQFVALPPPRDGRGRQQGNSYGYAASIRIWALRASGAEPPSAQLVEHDGTGLKPETRCLQGIQGCGMKSARRSLQS